MTKQYVNNCDSSASDCWNFSCSWPSDSSGLIKIGSYSPVKAAHHAQVAFDFIVLSLKANEFQNLACTNRKISSRHWRFTAVLGSVFCRYNRERTLSSLSTSHHEQRMNFMFGDARTDSSRRAVHD